MRKMNKCLRQNKEDYNVLHVLMIIVIFLIGIKLFFFKKESEKNLIFLQTNLKIWEYTSDYYINIASIFILIPFMYTIFDCNIVKGIFIIYCLLTLKLIHIYIVVFFFLINFLFKKKLTKLMLPMQEKNKEGRN